MTSTSVSQKEYIKRYLSKSVDKKKRKKKKHDVASKSKLRIVDDDIDLSSMRPVGDDELELYNLDEDAPQVAGIIDERPEELRTLEEFRESKRWKVVSDSTSDIKITELNTSIRNNNNSESNVTEGEYLINGKKHNEKIPLKKEKESSDDSPPRKRRPLNDNESSEKALEVQIKSERLTDSDSDISVSRNSGLRQQNGSEHRSLKKQEREQNLPHRRKGSYDEGKKFVNNSDGSNYTYEGEERLTGKLPHRAREKLEGVKRGTKQRRLSEESDSDLSPPRPAKSRDTEKYQKFEDGKKRRKKKWQSEDNDSDLSPPRPSKSRGREKNKYFEDVKEKQRKRRQSEGSDSDLSPPRPSNGRNDEKFEDVKEKWRKKRQSEDSDSDLSLPRHSKGRDSKKLEDVKEKQRKKLQSEDSDPDLSPPRHTKGRDKEKNKKFKDVKGKRRKKQQSEDGDSDMSLPRPSKGRDRENNKNFEDVKEKRRKKQQSEDSDSDLSPLRPAKSRDTEKYQKFEDGKKRRKKKWQSEDNDSDLSAPRPSKSIDREKNKYFEDVKEKLRKKRQSEDSDSDLSLPRTSNSRTGKYERRAEVKDGHRRGWPNEDEDKDKNRSHHSSSKERRKKVKESSEESDSGSLRSDTLNRHTPREKNKRDTKQFSRNGIGSESLQPQPSRSKDASSEKQGGRSGREVIRRREARDGSSSSSGRPPRPGPRSDRSPEERGKKLRKTLDGKQAGLQDARQLREEMESLAEREKEMFSKMSDDVSGRLAEAVKRDRKTGKKRDLDEEAHQQREKDEKDQKFKEKYSRWGKGLKQVEDQKQKLEEAMRVMAKPLARYADDQDLDRHLREQEREGDPMLDYIRSKKSSSDSNTKARPKYQGSYPTNRFGIPPGYRWDGVDRSNGYEKQWFEQRSAQKAREEEAYKWSTADM